MENEKVAIKVSKGTIILNTILAIFKLGAGIFGKSSAMLSDAIHTLSDVLSTFIVIIGVKMANKKADKEHPYGHERFECVAAIILSVMLGLTGLAIGLGGVEAIISGDYTSFALPGMIALIAAITSIIAKEGMYWYTINAAVKINSSALRADAWHHRSDAFSSIGSFIGVLGARLGYPILDSLACLIISLLIIKAALDIFNEAINKMTDHACDDETSSRIKEIILSHDQVESIDVLKTRLFGDKIYVEVELVVDGNLSLQQAHDIAHEVHDDVEDSFTNIKHCMIHVNPK